MSGFCMSYTLLHGFKKRTKRNAEDTYPRNEKH